VITVHVTDRNGTRVDPELVTGVLSSPDNGVAGIDVTLTHDGASWVSTDAVVPIAGAWTLQLTVTIDQAHAYATATTFRAW
jgi:copper transport protein